MVLLFPASIETKFSASHNGLINISSDPVGGLHSSSQSMITGYSHSPLFTAQLQANHVFVLVSDVFKLFSQRPLKTILSMEADDTALDTR